MHARYDGRSVARSKRFQSRPGNARRPLVSSDLARRISRILNVLRLGGVQRSQLDRQRDLVRLDHDVGQHGDVTLRVDSAVQIGTRPTCRINPRERQIATIKHVMATRHGSLPKRRVILIRRLLRHPHWIAAAQGLAVAWAPPNLGSV